MVKGDNAMTMDARHNDDRREAIRRAFERNSKALAKRPSLGQGTAVTRVRVDDGLRCSVEDGTWTFTADLGAHAGGGDAGANPGVFGRTALGTCLAMTYVMWATRLGVTYQSLHVEVQADYDSRGYHGVGDVRPGYEAIRYVVSVESDEPEAAVHAWLDESDAHCDFRHVFAEPQELTREIRLTSRVEVAS
jgi:uncharacterized OsmC-like protein